MFAILSMISFQISPDVVSWKIPWFLPAVSVSWLGFLTTGTWTTWLIDNNLSDQLQCVRICQSPWEQRIQLYRNLDGWDSSNNSPSHFWVCCDIGNEEKTEGSNQSTHSSSKCNASRETNNGIKWIWKNDESDRWNHFSCLSYIFHYFQHMLLDIRNKVDITVFDCNIPWSYYS